MIKKVKNNIPATKLNKEEIKMPSAEVIETVVAEALETASAAAAPKIEKIAEDTVAAVSSSFSCGDDDSLEPAGISVAAVRRHKNKADALYNDGRAPELESFSDKPIVTVGGKIIELTESKGPSRISASNRWHDDSDHSLLTFSENSTRYNSGHWSKRKVGNKEIKWYEATVGGILIYVTNGSMLKVTEGMDSNSWEYDECMGETSIAEVVLIGSVLETQYLSAKGYNVLNNSSLSSKNYTTLTSAVISASTVSSDSNTSVIKSVLTSAMFIGNNYLNVDNSILGGTRIVGFGRVTLREVKSYVNEVFSLSGWGRHGVTRPSVDISKISLTKFDGNCSNMSDAFKDWTDLDNSWADPTLVITRRVDYGTFSADENIPFIRVGNTDIIVGDQVFKGSEFVPVDNGPIHNVAEPIQPQYGFGYSLQPEPYRAPIGLGVLNTGSVYRGSVLWNRTAKVMYGYKYGKRPIGKTGESLVNTLIEQIRSRIGLYVEIINFGK